MLDRLTALFVSRPETAEAWIARLARPDAGARDQAAFQAWLEGGADRLRQYEAAKADLAALEALRGVFADDLVRLKGGRARSRVSRRGLVLAGGLAVAGVAAAVVLTPLMGGSMSGRLYESAPGRITELTLEDGSRVTLDADSAIRVDLDEDVRRVRLERGSAYFDVTHASEHPFQVSVIDRKVIVTGTRFTVSLTSEGAEASLLEGRIVIGRHDAGRRHALAEAVTVAPGERATFRRGVAGVRKVRADVETQTAWRRQRLIFQDAPLSEVIAAAARYSDAPLVLADPTLQRLRVTAVLPLDDPHVLEGRLVALLPIRTERTSDGRILIRAE